MGVSACISLALQPCAVRGPVEWVKRTDSFMGVSNGDVRMRKKRVMLTECGNAYLLGNAG